MLDLITILLAAGTMLALAMAMGYILGWANNALHVEVDPKVEAVNEALPQANCGGCGFVGCSEFAEAVVAGKAPVTGCPVGGSACAEELAEIMGVSVEESAPLKAMVHCVGQCENLVRMNEYRGEKSCAAAKIVAGLKGCPYSCLGLGDCVVVCHYDAIKVVGNLAVVDYDKCVGCNACVRACPQGIISMVPFKYENMPTVVCSNADLGPDVKKVCSHGCITCKVCAKKSEIFTIEGNLARINYEEYDANKHQEGLEEAIAKCPQKIIQMVGPSEASPSEKLAAADAEKKKG